jgi:hypothetical protein
LAALGFRLRRVALVGLALAGGGCSSPSPMIARDDGGGAGGVGGVGATGGAGGAAGGGVRAWAAWPMPNQPGLGLPHEQRYTVVTATSTADEVVRDDVTGLVWQRLLSSRTFTWNEAVDYCDGLTLAGGGDWRLPSRIELVSLLDLSQTDPAINRDAFPNTPGEWFWTASRQAGNPTNAWYVYFYFGYPDTDDQQRPFRARCVR